MNRADLPVPVEGFVTTHFLVAADIKRTAAFYADVLGGEIVFAADGAPAIVKLANTWVIINSGGGPTPDKPTVVLEPPADPHKASAFMNIRVADMEASYAEWKERGAEFLTEPLDNHGVELRCYMRDPDGRIIEVGQATGMVEILGIDVSSSEQ
jgi:catechol 2,3-dioxygenase-like lactoylglutathione lyase family enzyme